MSKKILALVLTVALAGALRADHRLFTCVYEPETESQGEWEYEGGVTLGAFRNAMVGQRDYQHWQFFHEIEYGVSDRFTTSVRLDHGYESFVDPVSNERASKYTFSGITSENRFQLLNPVDNLVGLTLYVEPTWNGQDAELEEKIIIGQRHGDMKWAVNLTHATDWSDHFRGAEGEVELSAGVAWEIRQRWSAGFEVRNHNELPGYDKWENSALYAGPVIGYHRLGWWAALSVMPQIYGHNFGENPDGNRRLELQGHERLNIRLLFGFDF